MEIYKKLLEIQKEVDKFVKDSQSHNYNYVSGNQVLNKIRPLMNEKGLILKQEVLSIKNTRQDYEVWNKFEKEFRTKSEILSNVQMRFTWIDCETGEKDENLFGANGQNDWEKGLGSALTYGERYFLLKFFHVPTDADDIDNPKRKENNNSFKKDDETPVVWLNEKQLNKAISEGAETIKKMLSFYDGKTIQQDGNKYSMKKAFREQLNNALN